ncbi:MAG: glycosyltransferase involved in cell wall biosynthesis [Saprospiraceae bacterium]|jgi:glycosyltransferase involved in cell wall biosynthesis
MSILFTVIIPTHDHQDTLHYSIKSVLEQSFQDFEIVVIGDGAPDRTEEIVKEYCNKDARVKYFHHVKGKGHGETYKNEAIVNSAGKYIAYLGDDDMWLENHLETLIPYLSRFDFVHTRHTSINTNGDISFLESNLEDVAIRNKMIQKQWNFFGPTCVSHTRAAYLKLPFGWRPKPEGMWSDLYMWRQWFSQQDLSFYTIPANTTLHFPSTLRPNVSLSSRIEELETFDKRRHLPHFGDELNKLKQSEDLVRFSESLGIKEKIADLHIKIDTLNTIIVGQGLKTNKLQQENKHKNKSIIYYNTQLIEQRNEVSRLSNEINDLKSAVSTRIGFALTYPLRKIYELISK